MPTNTPTTVYIPTLVSEKPAEAGVYMMVVPDSSVTPMINRWDGKVWWNDPYSHSHWLKPVTGYFHTKKELGKLLSHVWDVAYSHFDGAGGPADDFLEGKEKFIQSLLNKTS